MSDYTKTTDFAAKDNFLSGNPLKLITGTAHDTEYNNIATAIATKHDAADIGVTVQAYSANLNEYAAVNPTVAGLALLDDIDAAAQRTTLGLGTAATANIGLSAGNVQQVDQPPATIVRAATTVLAGSLNCEISDTGVAVAAFNGTAGATYSIKFLGAGDITHGAGLSILQTGANITTAAGDTARVRMLTGTTCELFDYQRASGKALTSSSTIVQVVEGIPYTTYSSTSVAIPGDDTIPQNTEGAEWVTVTITPTNASNRLRIEADIGAFSTSANSGVYTCFALFQDSIVDALASSVFTSNISGYVYSQKVVHEMVAGTTNATIFKLRGGTSTGFIMYVNGYNTSRLYGGTLAIRIRVTEIKV